MCCIQRKAAGAFSDQTIDILANISWAASTFRAGSRFEVEAFSWAES
jgi:hypothetical protein